MTRTLRFVGILCSAVVMGLTFTHVLQAPGSMSLSGAQWLGVQHTFYGGFAVAGGICEFLGLVSTVTLSVILLIRRRARDAVVPLVAAACFVGTLLAYVFGNAPVNAKVAVWTAATLPPDWSAYRASWEAAHAVSAAASVIAFLVMTIAVVWSRRLSSPEGTA